MVFHSSVLLLIMNLLRWWHIGSADYFQNVTTKSIVNNGTEKLRNDVNLFFSVTNCQIVRSRSFAPRITCKFRAGVNSKAVMWTPRVQLLRFFLTNCTLSTSFANSLGWEISVPFYVRAELLTHLIKLSALSACIKNEKKQQSTNCLCDRKSKRPIYSFSSLFTVVNIQIGDNFFFIQLQQWRLSSWQSYYYRSNHASRKLQKSSEIVVVKPLFIILSPRASS